MKISNKTRLNMVIGYPLTHSQSPLLHQVLYQTFGIDAVLLVQTHPSLISLIQAVKILSIELIAVTLPYKEKVVEHLDVISDEVAALHAANTIIQRNGKLYGYNTDVDGISFALRNITLKNKKILIIGAGGAARAMGYFLKKKQTYIFWLNRTKEKAVTLAYQFGGEAITSNDLKKYTFDVIINASSVGLYPQASYSPLPQDILHAKQIVFDMVYHPAQTMLLKQAKLKQAMVISGLDMFIAQGLKQVELLIGQTYTCDIDQLVKNLNQLLILNQ